MLLLVIDVSDGSEPGLYYNSMSMVSDDGNAGKMGESDASAPGVHYNNMDDIEDRGSWEKFG